VIHGFFDTGQTSGAALQSVRVLRRVDDWRYCCRVRL
jgi:hypothetical protein